MNLNKNEANNKNLYLPNNQDHSTKNRIDSQYFVKLNTQYKPISPVSYDTKKEAQKILKISPQQFSKCKLSNPGPSNHLLPEFESDSKYYNFPKR